MNSIPLKFEFEFYRENQPSLVQQYAGKYLVIKGSKVHGAYDTELDAVREGAKSFPVGTFLVQKCENGDASFTQIFHSRVAFA